MTKGKATTTERTMRMTAPSFHSSGKAWRDFSFERLEKVSRWQMLLASRLEWLLPGLAATGHATEAVQKRLAGLFDEEVRLVIDYVHVIAPKQLKKYVSEPTFLAVLAPQPHKTRSLLEVELGFAHEMIDVLLGGAGEAVALRPLSDIEEGVMTYVIIETLKALTPHVDPGLPRLRLESVAHGIDETLQLIADESHIAVVQLKSVVGKHSGFLRLFLPATLIGMLNPPSDGPEVRARRSAEAVANIGRLRGVQTYLRAEIGYTETDTATLADLRQGDVVVLDRLTARTDKGEPGTAVLKVGRGQVGHWKAELSLEEGRYHATITELYLGSSPAAPASVEVQGEAGHPTGVDIPEAKEDNDVDENPSNANGGSSELLNDIPLQISVELARIPINAEEVIALKVGQILDLNKVPGEPVELSVNNRVVARGELVEVEGHLGVRVLSLTG